MNAIELGPFVFATERFAFLLAAVTFFGSFHLLTLWHIAGVREDVRAWAIPAAMIWLLGARTGYVMQQWDVFSQHPLDIPKVWQGGVSVWTGFAGLVAFAILAYARRRAAVAPLLAAAFAGGLVNLGLLSLKETDETAALPTTAFPTMAGDFTQLNERDGAPLILNLWASWCPPCRREMPMMMDVANTIQGADLVFANQAETPAQVTDFLDTLGLGDRHLLLDPTSSLMARFDAVGLPTTLFFDASGTLQNVHFGEISRAELLSQIATIDTAASNFGDGDIPDPDQTGDSQ